MSGAKEHNTKHKGGPPSPVMLSGCPAASDSDGLEKMKGGKKKKGAGVEFKAVRIFTHLSVKVNKTWNILNT